MKDLFVSYGRRESLVFTGRLHQLVKLAGYDAWFDKVNIPDGDDYAQRISHGIESAHNFAYVMAPRCMTSPYCLIELEYARLLGKRVIPLAQIVIFETPAKELSAADKQVMINFYQTYGIKGVTINTEADVLKRSHELIGRTDWVYAREEYSPEDIKAMFDWQAGYENTWFKHDNTNYLKEYKFPTFGKSIDALEGVAEAVLRLVDKHNNYVHTHTEILQQALKWHKGNKETVHLLVGAERKKAEQWIVTEFEKPEQPPCVISAFHAEFICESRKNAENLFTDVFISYDSEDKDLRDAVYKSLSQHLVTTWLHHKDIAKGKNFEEAIRTGIEQSKYMLFFISNDSLQSEWCMKELEYATSLNKKIIPLLIEKLSNARLLQENAYINKLQYIDFTNNENPVDYDRDLADILKEIHTDDSYYEQHRTFLCQALKWQRQNNNDSILLQGNLLANARNWLKAGSTKPHPPLPLHYEFIEASITKIGKVSSEVFVSYSRNDGDFARKINTDLQTLGSTTWFDQESIPVGATNFEEEIRNGIAHSDNFLFLISAKSVNSPYCKGEVEYAVSLNKRIITVLVETLDEETKKVFRALPKLSQVQWIDLRPNHSYEKGFEQLYRSIKSDGEYVKSHTNWGRKAADWEKSNKKPELLLRGIEANTAEKWLQEALKLEKYPEPTPLQKEFIARSKEAVLANRRKEVNTIRKLRGLFLFSCIALLVSFYAYIIANMQKKLSELSYLTTVAQKNINIDPIKAIRAAELVYDRGNEIGNQHFSTSAVEATKEALQSLQETGQMYVSLQNTGHEEWVYSGNRQEIYAYEKEANKENGEKTVGGAMIRVLDTNFVEKRQFSVKGHIASLQSSPDGKLLLLATQHPIFSSSSKQLWTPEGKLVQEFEHQLEGEAHFSKDSQRILLMYGDSTKVYHLPSKKTILLPPHHKISNTSVALQDNGNYFFVENTDSMPAIRSFWNVNTNQAEWEINPNYNLLSITPNQKYIVGVLNDTLICFNNKGNIVWQKQIYSSIDNIWLNNDKYVFGSYSQNTIFRIALDNPKDSSAINMTDVMKMSYVTDSTTLIQCYQAAHVWNHTTSGFSLYLRHEAEIKEAFVTPNLQYLLTIDVNRNLRKWTFDRQQARDMLATSGTDAQSFLSYWLKSPECTLPILDKKVFGFTTTTLDDLLKFYIGIGISDLLTLLVGLIVLVFIGFSTYYLFKRKWRRMFACAFMAGYFPFTILMYVIGSWILGTVCLVGVFFILHRLLRHLYPKTVYLVRSAFFPASEEEVTESLQK